LREDFLWKNFWEAVFKHHDFPESVIYLGLSLCLLAFPDNGAVRTEFLPKHTKGVLKVFIHGEAPLTK
jgi:hypothetical protein